MDVDAGPKHQLARMRRERFGSTSETLDPLHLRLKDEEITVSAAFPEMPVESEERDTPKRRPLPHAFPRPEQVVMPGEACRACGAVLRPDRGPRGVAVSRADWRLSLSQGGGSAATIADLWVVEGAPRRRRRMS